MHRGGSPGEIAGDDRSEGFTTAGTPTSGGDDYLIHALNLAISAQPSSLTANIRPGGRPAIKDPERIIEIEEVRAKRAPAYITYLDHILHF